MEVTRREADGTAGVWLGALSNAPTLDLRQDPYPSCLRCWHRSPLELPDEGSHFGFVQRGRARLRSASGDFEVRPGMYFCVPGAGRIEGGSGVVATRIGERALFCLGGPVEHHGRLRYIDGCRDTLLIAPPMRGEACLNLLEIPAHTRQSSHTHPSLRMGVIASGEGRCVTERGAAPLAPGIVFTIPAGVRHSFHTQRAPLRVIAYHPDSDCGPTHHDHPMLNRTLLD